MNIVAIVLVVLGIFLALATDRGTIICFYRITNNISCYRFR